MFDWRFRPRVTGVERRVSSQQRSDKSADFAVVAHIFSSLLQEKEGRFRIDIAHHIELSFTDFSHRLLENFADRVHRDVDAAHGFHGVRKQFLHRCGLGQISLKLEGLGASSLDRGDRLVGFGFARSAVVVNGDGLRALLCQVDGQQSTEIFSATRDEDSFPLML